MMHQVSRMFVNKLHVCKFCFRFLPRISCSKRLSTQTSSAEIEDESNLERTTDNFTSSLYDDHIQTSLLQKALLTIGSSILSITDPYRHDMVAVLGETTGYVAAKQIRDKMLQDPEGSSILRDKPRINSDTLDYQFLESLPQGSLGHAYMDFLKDNAKRKISEVLSSMVCKLWISGQFSDECIF
ncbi:unnamed protein product [Larinioides sclopetarius]|uniref:Ubiquinone biosynthesis protein n=1 Tax=Larinioides sclopetarius TaxID=280406 RepID=A0AAV1ZYQ3_9ARAC